MKKNAEFYLVPGEILHSNPHASLLPSSYGSNLLFVVHWTSGISRLE
jgi:hypothetical protein